ncbi:MAG: hypothetical protein DCO96_06625 [Fluviicola sp. XM-24bin1]|nr:MAG: hypothetical protein DCO96_06625 [Fluviicola sp. XM-24bin1]
MILNRYFRSKFNRMKSILLVTFSLLVSLSTFAQNAEGDGVINGKVSEKGDALIGVTAFIEGSSIGAFTDIEGNFELDVSSYTKEKITIKFTYVGYKTVRVSFDSVEEALNTFIFVEYKKPKKFTVTKTPE